MFHSDDTVLDDTFGLEDIVFLFKASNRDSYLVSLFHSFLGGRLGKLKKLVENMLLDCLTMAIG